MAGEIGYQVDTKVRGWLSFAAEAQETNPALQWPKSNEVYDQMRREDSQVGSVLRAVTLPIRAARWSIDPTGCREEVVDLIATDLGLPVKGRTPVAPLRRKDRFSWKEHLRLALLELVYGHSVFEQVYRPDGDMLRLRKLAWRPPRTISEVDVARDGGLVSVKQFGSKVPIPVDRLVMYVNEREGGAWLGQSLLRTAYKVWLLKDRGLRVQAMSLERNGLGVPVYTGAPIPDGVKGDAAKQHMEQQKADGLEVATGFRAGETAGASIPQGSKLELLGVMGKLPDADPALRYYDEAIARAVLAHFLNLGTETGSWALGSTFADFFTGSLNAVAGHIAEVTQQHVIEDLVDLNWGEQEPAPQLVCEPIGAESLATSTVIKELLDCGAIRPSEALEEFSLQRYGLPVSALLKSSAPAVSGSAEKG